MTQNQSESIFFRRQSKRAYRPTPVPAEALQRILEKTRWAPSCANRQSWQFVIVQDPAVLARFQEALNRGNAWAKKAPVLVAVAARAEDACQRRDEPMSYHLFDCGLAVENFLLASVEEGLMGHPMAGYNSPTARQALGIPEEYAVVCLISLGYPGDIADLDEQTRIKDERPRTRKRLEENFFFDGWPAG
jgi:nitroreductase